MINRGCLYSERGVQLGRLTGDGRVFFRRSWRRAIREGNDGGRGDGESGVRLGDSCRVSRSLTGLFPVGEEASSICRDVQSLSDI